MLAYLFWRLVVTLLGFTYVGAVLLVCTSAGSPGGCASAGPALIIVVVGLLGLGKLNELDQWVDSKKPW